jgi:hypothetical protein
VVAQKRANSASRGGPFLGHSRKKIYIHSFRRAECLQALYFKAASYFVTINFIKMPHQETISQWRGANPKQRANIFLKLDDSDRREVVQNLTPMEGKELLDEFESVEAQLIFLNCTTFDQAISILAIATETCKAIVDAIKIPSLQEQIHQGIKAYRFLETPTSAEAILHELKNPSPKSGGPKPVKIIVFTDIGRDIDDAILLIILAYLHKIKVVEILLVVANVDPTDSRAKEAKSIVEKMGVPDVPVACGTNGTDELIKLHNHELLEHECKEHECRGHVRNEHEFSKYKLEHEFKGFGEPHGTILLDGETAIVERLEALEKEKEHCSMIVIASLRDLEGLIKKHGSLVQNTVSSFFFQGGWEADQEHIKTLVPDMKAVNNKYDRDATTYVYNWIREGNIPTYTATRSSAIEASISSDTFREAADIGNPVARYIYDAFVSQERKFFDDSADPNKRFMEHMDIGWYANRHPRWRKARGDALPKTFEEIEPFLGMVLYDVVAGLICPLQERNFVDQIYQPHQQKILIDRKKVDHYIIGRQVEKKVLPDVNPELLSNVIIQLLQEGLFKTT